MVFLLDQPNDGVADLELVDPHRLGSPQAVDDGNGRCRWSQR